MSNTILKFIEHFQNIGTIDTFTNGCCYWFAKILAERFQGTIMYNPVDNHFATLIDTQLYDITGDIENDLNWMEWSQYRQIEPSDSQGVINQCINFTDDGFNN